MPCSLNGRNAWTGSLRRISGPIEVELFSYGSKITIYIGEWGVKTEN
jgi:hypothetical protein